MLNFIITLLQQFFIDSKQRLKDKKKTTQLWCALKIRFIKYSFYYQKSNNIITYMFLNSNGLMPCTLRLSLMLNNWDCKCIKILTQLLTNLSHNGKKWGPNVVKTWKHFDFICKINVIFS